MVQSLGTFTRTPGKDIMLRKIVGGVVFAVFFVIGLFTPGGPASADPWCGIKTYTDVQNVSIKNAAGTENTNAQVSLLDSGGVRIKLPDAGAKATAMWTTNGSVKLAEIRDLGYWTKKYDTETVVLPAYQLVIDFNGEAEGGFTTLVYEPYLNGGVVSQGHNWDAFTGVWWSTRAIPGQATRDVRLDLAEIAQNNPDATITAWGINVGSGNQGADVAWNRVLFKTQRCSVTQSWKAPSATESPTTNPTHTPTPTPTKTASHGNPGPSPTLSGGVGGGRETLPVTGSPVSVLLWVGIGIVVLGVLAVVLAGRKRSRPEL